MSGIFPTSAADLARSAGTYISELARSIHSSGDRTAADAFAAVQSFPMECTGRPTTTEITKELLGVPSDVNAFDDRLKRQLDEAVGEIKGMYIVDIQITALVSHPMFEERGRKRVEAVWQYLFRQRVNPNLMSMNRSEGSRMVGVDSVKIKIIGVPREQAPIVKARTMPDKSALSCTVRFNDGTSITAAPR